MGDATPILDGARRRRPTDLAPAEAAFHDDRSGHVVARPRVAYCRCTTGHVCRHNNACPRGGR